MCLYKGSRKTEVPSQVPTPITPSIEDMAQQKLSQGNRPFLAHVRNMENVYSAASGTQDSEFGGSATRGQQEQLFVAEEEPPKKNGPPPHPRSYIACLLVLLLVPPTFLLTLPALYWAYQSDKYARRRQYYLAWKYYNRVYYFAMVMYISLVAVLIWACCAFFVHVRPFQCKHENNVIPSTPQPNGPSLEFLETNHYMKNINNIIDDHEPGEVRGMETGVKNVKMPATTVQESQGMGDVEIETTVAGTHGGWDNGDKYHSNTYLPKRWKKEEKKEKK